MLWGDGVINCDDTVGSKRGCFARLLAARPDGLCITRQFVEGPGGEEGKSRPKDGPWRWFRPTLAEFPKNNESWGKWGGEYDYSKGEKEGELTELQISVVASKDTMIASKSSLVTPSDEAGGELSTGFILSNAKMVRMPAGEPCRKNILERGREGYPSRGASRPKDDPSKWFRATGVGRPNLRESVEGVRLTPFGHDYLRVK